MLTKETPLRHRYPWSLEEKIIIIAFFLAGPLTLLIPLLTSGDFNWLSALVVTGIGSIVAVLLILLGKKRKKASSLYAYKEGNILTVYGFGLNEQNRLNMSAVQEVTTRKHGISDSFVFWSSNREKGKSLIVPIRMAAASEEMTQLVVKMCETAIAKNSEVKDLLARLK